MSTEAKAVNGSTDRVSIDQSICTGCGKCLAACPTDVFRMTEVAGRDVAYAAYPHDCCDCFLCELDCPVHCINVMFAPIDHGFVSIYKRMSIELPSLDGS